MRTRADAVPWGQATALGLGMGAIALAAGVYNAYVPLLLRGYLGSELVVAILVAVRTVAGIVANVVVAARSDRPHGGRRRLWWVLVWMPPAGVLFALLPWRFGATYLVVVDLVYAVVSSLFYAPVVALLADVVPDVARSRANGLIAAMAGAASLVAFFVGPALHAVFAPLPFLVVGGALVAVSVVLVRVVREPEVVAAPSQPSLRRVLAALRRLGESPRRPVALVLLGAFAWTGAVTSVESLFVTYAVYRLHVSSGAAVVSVGVFALAYLAAAVPAGFLGHRLGRRWTVVLGLAIAGASFGVVAGVHQLAVVRGVAAIAGVGWALANVSAYPLLVGLVGANDTGLATGLWLLATGVGGAVLEPLIGLAMDVLGYAWLLIAAAVLFGVGAVAVALARHRGEEPVALVVDA